MIVAVAYHLAVNYAVHWDNGRSDFGFWHTTVGQAPEAIGLMMLAVWNLALISGRWTAEPTWIDRCGRVLGLWWIGCAMVNGVVYPVAFFIFLSPAPVAG